MERKMANLFDFQRFQQDPKLKKVIQEAESRYTGALDDDDLAFVSAAGDEILMPPEGAGVMDVETFGASQYMVDPAGGLSFHPPLTETEKR